MSPRFKPGFAHAHRRNPNEASASVARKLWLLIELMQRGRVSFIAYEDLHRRDYRSFQRDLQQLRTIGRDRGFELSPIREKAYVELVRGPKATRKLPSDAANRLIGSIATALGEPIRAELASVAPDGALDPFYTFAIPQLIEGTRVAEIARILREAAHSDGGRAIVAFRYRAMGERAAAERRVEPYRLLVRSGCFYLVAYDLRRRAWRSFALDRIEGSPRRDGTAQRQRTIPPEYASTDVIGFIKGHGTKSVTVRVSPRVAVSATARRWQTAQRTALMLDGSAELTFRVADESEVIRWALGFGAEAKVVAPPSAVKAAATLAAQIAAEYTGATSRSQDGKVKA
jgi:predicted DNA-binding transcriptional regulator YafY